MDLAKQPEAQEMTLEEFVAAYVTPYFRARMEAAADEFDRRTAEQVNYD